MHWVSVTSSSTPMSKTNLPHSDFFQTTKDIRQKEEIKTKGINSPSRGGLEIITNLPLLLCVLVLSAILFIPHFYPDS